MSTMLMANPLCLLDFQSTRQLMGKHQSASENNHHYNTVTFVFLDLIIEHVDQPLKFDFRSLLFRFFCL